MDVGGTIDEAEFRKPLTRCAMKKEAMSPLKPGAAGEGRGSLVSHQKATSISGSRGES